MEGIKVTHKTHNYPPKPSKLEAKRKRYFKKCQNTRQRIKRLARGMK